MGTSSCAQCFEISILNENCSGHPLFGIENRATNQREFTVTLPSRNKEHSSNNDVVYDVHG